MSESRDDRREPPAPGPVEDAGGEEADPRADPDPEPVPDAFERLELERLRSFAREHFLPFVRLPFSRLHEYLFLRRIQKTRRKLLERRGEIDVVLAPRGAAKSTILTQLLPIHALVRQTERYILIVSATHRQSRGRLANIRNAMRGSQSLMRKYPAVGERWPVNRADCIELMDVRVEACSAGSELRGLAFGEWRPTWIILDDIEDSRRIRTPEYRDRLFDWLREVIEYLGDTFTNIDLIGTLLHRDALPERLRPRPDVRYRKYRAIMREADRQDLWREWRELVRDAESPDDLEAARWFFDARRELMLAGSEALWPDKEDYYALQLMRAHQGPTAFDKEKQNAPHFAGGGIFKLADIPRFSVIEGAVAPGGHPAREGAGDDSMLKVDELSLYGFLDPVRQAGGPTSRRDFAAIATVGVDNGGRLFVLDVWLERAAPSRQVLKAFDLHARWNYTLFGVETTAFQKLLMEHLEAERVRRRERGEISNLPLRSVERKDDKRWRIMRLEPKVTGGVIYLADDLDEEFLRQLEAFPEGAHDDGPDALAGAAELALERLQRKRETLKLARPGRDGVRRF